ncbi:hypothetical protein [Kroppenstedtia sanguinis]|uniref:Uncharacterized protein n=1 Tax=Kroppenstedtia sanguinis TaxID=1380684 RepID=A0ABW4CC12_9BACL
MKVVVEPNRNHPQTKEEEDGGFLNWMGDRWNGRILKNKSIVFLMAVGKTSSPLSMKHGLKEVNLVFQPAKERFTKSIWERKLEQKVRKL